MTDHDVDQVLENADRVYLITKGKVRTHGTPNQIVRDPVAIEEYLGASYYGKEYGHTPGAGPAVAVPTAPAVPQVREQERVRRLVEALMAEDEEARGAFAELVQIGERSVPALVEALERRDLEMRRRALATLQRLIPDVSFDPYAPDAQRRAQLIELRE